MKDCIRISKLIEILEGLKAEHGDIPVMVLNAEIGYQSLNPGQVYYEPESVEPALPPFGGIDERITLPARVVIE